MTKPSKHVAPFSQQGLAEEFAAKSQGRLAWDGQKWREWDGRRWIGADVMPSVVSFAKQQTKKSTDPDRKDRMLSHNFLKDIGKLARYEKCIQRRPEDFDADPYLLNTPDGIVDLRTGKMNHHDPFKFCSKITRASPVGHCPTWQRVLEDATGGDADLIAFLQRWFGYALTGDTREHAVAFIHGPGGSGKSLVVNAVQRAMGDYGRALPMSSLMTARNDQHSTDLAGLAGFRLVVGTETGANAAWNESKLKQITGGDVVSARLMHRDFVDFKPALKLTLVGNHLPRTASVGRDMQRRLRVVPFRRSVAVDRVDTRLADKLDAEAGGILAWAVAGAVEWHKTGLGSCAAVQEASRRYFADADVIGRFLADCCVISTGAWAASSALYVSFGDWCRQNGERQVSQKAFSADLGGRHGVTKSDRRNARGFSGIALPEAASTVFRGDFNRVDGDASPEGVTH
ncbi:MAG: phage/plasmid primase, P4 family [Alphaproteobacteria bacterium]|nr:phage/plasmid primase, P4 family [Alphaproteobacteria bacterium]